MFNRRARWFSFRLDILLTSYFKIQKLVNKNPRFYLHRLERGKINKNTLLKLLISNEGTLPRV